MVEVLPHLVLWIHLFFLIIYKEYKETIFNLSTTQDKIKRDNNLYNEEFKKILDQFIIKFNIFLEVPNKKIFGIKELFLFFSHVASIYPKEIAFLPL